MKIGQILLHRSLIARDQLREALRRQARTGAPLGQVLVRMGIVSRQAVLDALRLQPRAVVDMARLERLEQPAVALLPASLCHALCCVPLVAEEGYLLVAMADPLDAPAIARIEAESGHRVVALAAPAEQLRTWLNTRPAAPNSDHADAPAIS